MIILFLFLSQVRIQLGEGSAGQVTKNMLANEGIRSFYKVCSSVVLITLFTIYNVVALALVLTLLSRIALLPF